MQAARVRDPLAAVFVLFALVGAVFGSWAARVPDVSAQVGAGHSALGVALFCISAGALVSMQTAGGLCARWGAGRVSAAGAVAASVAVVLPGLAGSMGSLCVALLLFGAATGLANVAANSLGVQVQQAVGRPVMSTLHAGFSFGGLGGALVGGVASTVLPAGWHLLAVGVLGLGVSVVIAPALAGFVHVEAAPVPSRERPTAAGAAPVIVVLGLIAGCTAFAEGALTDWASLHLREDLHATPMVAGAGYAVFSLAMAAARLRGRSLIVRYGDTVVLTSGALLAAVGMLVGAAAPSPFLALAGFVLVGFGLANVFPLAIAKAGLLGGARGVARASSVGYTGLLGGPPIIGLLAGERGLPFALTSVSALAVVAALLALVVDHRLDGAGSVASVLRAQARARLQPIAVRVEAAAQNHSKSLYLLLDQS
ncbi:MFS transporter [Actinoplanes palleronii]|uniref:MFS transporter n=1 Tax=Actinoplanes palleronii TaxID=113570 RepID=A0ABQ4BJH8_9ACTN|nr:MFS transporter [Actinoplanes palleronii]GIE70837.1 MFS transporter [Actinoplanes palleronii]